MSNSLTIAIRQGNLTHYHICEDEEHNAAYLNHIGFSRERAFEIASWAATAPENAEYEQDDLPGVQIRIL